MLIDWLAVPSVDEAPALGKPQPPAGESAVGGVEAETAAGRAWLTERGFGPEQQDGVRKHGAALCAALCAGSPARCAAFSGGPACWCDRPGARRFLFCVCNQMCINCAVVSQLRPHKPEKFLCKSVAGAGGSAVCGGRPAVLCAGAGSDSRRRVYDFAGIPSPFGKCFNRNGEGASAK